MKLSPKNEALLKSVIEGQNKEGVIKEISKKIEEMEKGMKTQITAGYTDVISRCFSLDDLKKRLEKIVDISREVRKEAENQIIQYTTIRDERESIQVLDERLIDIRQRYEEMAEYLEAAIFLDAQSFEEEVTESSDKIYHITQKLSKMNRLKGSFKQYSFYKSVSGIYKVRLERISGELQRGTEQWIQKVDMYDGGVDFRAEVSIFNPIAEYYKKLLPSYFYELVYGAKALGIEKRLSGVIEVELKRRIKDMSEKRIGVEVIVSLLLFDKVIQREFETFLSLKDKILDLLDEVKVRRMREVAWFRGRVSALQINSEKIEAFVERALFELFDIKSDTSNFFTEVKRFIEDSSKYLESCGSLGSDVEDMLVKKVDRVLADYVDGFNVSDKEFFGVQREVEEILDTLGTKIPSAAESKFAVRDVLGQRSAMIVDEEYRKIAKFIKETKDIRNILTAVLAIKKSISTECNKEVARRIVNSADELMAGKDQEDYDLLVSTLYKNYRL